MKITKNLRFLADLGFWFSTFSFRFCCVFLQCDLWYIKHVLIIIQHKDLFLVTSGALTVILETYCFSSCCIFKRYKTLVEWLRCYFCKGSQSHSTNKNKSRNIVE